MRKMAASRDAKDPWWLRDTLINRDRTAGTEFQLRSAVDLRLDMASESPLDRVVRRGRPR